MAGGAYRGRIIGAALLVVAASVGVTSAGAGAAADNSLIAPKPSTLSIVNKAPNAATTGVPSGTSLRIHKGDLVVRKAGAVVSGLEVRGRVIISAPNVTVRNTSIRGGKKPRFGIGLLTIVSKRARDFVVEDVTIRPRKVSPNFDAVKVNRRGVLRRLNISGTVDGVLVYGSGVRIESSYLHDFRHFRFNPNQRGGSHDDSIQVVAGSGIRIVGNTLMGARNAAVMVTQDVGPTNDLQINDNWIDNGACSVNFGSGGPYQSGIQVNNNRFGRAQIVADCAIVRRARSSDLRPVGNVWDSDDAPVSVSRGS